MDNYTQNTITMPESLPKNTYLPINHCNLSAKILGSLRFQENPAELILDSVYELHKKFFNLLKTQPNKEQRCQSFVDYMQLYFQFNSAEKSKLQASRTKQTDRLRANYLMLLQGWMFDSNNRDGAIIKGWVESRFGLLPRWHKKAIKSPDDESYAVYMHERTTGIYNTNSIESQLDLLYSYCQYELKILFSQKKHIKLYRGSVRVEEYECISPGKNKQPVLLLNNISSLSSDYERADEFGSTVYAINIPVSKIFYYSGLLPDKLIGENEYIAIGGLYKADVM